MKKVIAVLMAAGLMGALGTMFAAPAEAHGWRHNGCCAVRYYKPAPCCVHYRTVRYFKPIDRVVRKVSYEHVTAYRTVLAKKLYRGCGCHRFYRTVSTQVPVDKVVRKVSLEHVTYYKPYTVRKAYRRLFCGWMS
jgi:hypothetical protein